MLSVSGEKASRLWWCGRLGDGLVTRPPCKLRGSKYLCPLSFFFFKSTLIFVESLSSLRMCFSSFRNLRSQTFKLKIEETQTSRMSFEMFFFSFGWMTRCLVTQQMLFGYTSNKVLSCVAGLQKWLFGSLPPQSPSTADGRTSLTFKFNQNQLTVLRCGVAPWAETLRDDGDDCAVHTTQLAVLCRCGIQAMTGQRQEGHTFTRLPASLVSKPHLNQYLIHQRVTEFIFHGLGPGCARNSCTHVKTPTYQIPCVHTYEPYKSNNNSSALCWKCCSYMGDTSPWCPLAASRTLIGFRSSQ